ncbi:signal peptidase II [Floricoccus penangensis]|uniref:Lipoprotein signal peptidase n=1 Tax=Floricoccus penangensis TaxID=1859475 RepID=A0A9Q5JHP3_9LACT|nr:signal peptidase II [Floricoccus penangensis]OFI47734.1 signal peptidase II [Floricoccus penangensis]
MKKILVLLIIILGVAADQFVKFWTVKNIPLGDSIPFIKNILSLTHLQNTGAAWSMFEGKQWFFTIITAIALVVGTYYLVKNINKNNGISYSIALIIAGTLGNFIDRVRLGYVVDMFQLDFINFPIFNVADSFLTVGLILIYICIFREDSKKGKSKNK